MAVTGSVATILITDPDRTTAALIGAVVELVGATPVYEPGAQPDVLIIEPAEPGAVERAVALRAAAPGLPIVCVSVSRPTAELRRALAPAVYLTKPFAVARLQRILAALLPRPAR